MRRSTIFSCVLAVTIIAAVAAICGCGMDAQSGSGATQVNANIDLGTDGMTVEQENIKHRIEADNEENSIKYLYVISSYSGDIIYSDVIDGKATSDGKRLAPKNADTETTGSKFWYDMGNGQGYWTREVMNDDGTYGDADMDYFFYWTPKGEYRQIYPTGGVSIVISDTPLSDFGQVKMHVEVTNATAK